MQAGFGVFVVYMTRVRPALCMMMMMMVMMIDLHCCFDLIFRCPRLDYKSYVCIYNILCSMVCNILVIVVQREVQSSVYSDKGYSIQYILGTG